MRDRSELGFEQATKVAFGFLAEYGFLLASSSAQHVRYESPEVYFHVYHGGYDYEVGLHFGRRGTDEQFDFSVFLKLVSPQLGAELGEGIADTRDAVSKAVNRLANALRSEGKPILLGKAAVFDTMKGIHFWHFQSEVLNPEVVDLGQVESERETARRRIAELKADEGESVHDRG